MTYQGSIIWEARYSAGRHGDNAEAMSNAESLGMRFRRVPLTRYSTAGIPFQSGVSVGMPAVPDEMLRAVVYLYPTEDAARKGITFGGSGFLVGIQESGVNHAYVVTNYHVAIRPSKGLPNPFVRVNKKDGETDIFPLDVADYHFIPGHGDVAVARLPLESRVHDFKIYAFENLITKALAEGVLQVGEDVFMVGRFIDFDGGVTNRPALRFGNISMNPLPNRDMANSTQQDVAYYCVDMHSRTGFSGAPVWAYRTMGSDLHEAINGKTPEVCSPIAGILGIHCGQFPEKLKTNQGLSIDSWSGMTIVLPAWRIADLLMSMAVAQERHKAGLAMADQPKPAVQESANAEDMESGDAILRSALNTHPVKRRKPKAKRSKRARTGVSSKSAASRRSAQAQSPS